MLLLHRALALGAPRRTWASSMTSSWYSVARCTISMTAPATVDLPGVGFGPQLGGQHREQRPEPFAAGLEQMLHGLGHQLVGAAQLGLHERFDPRHAVADVAGRIGVAEVHPRHHARRCLTLPTYWAAWTYRRADDRGRWVDVVVVGAGPAGSAAAAWAARAGRDVLRDRLRAVPPRQGVRRRPDPARGRRDASCWGSARGSTAASRHRGLRMSGFGADVEVDWPGPSFPATGRARCRAPNSTTGSAMVAVDDGRQDAAGRESR